MRDGVVVATDNYTPGSGFVFNIGSQPFQLSATVDGHLVTMTVVPRSTSGTATIADVVVPAAGCASAASGQVS